MLARIGEVSQSQRFDLDFVSSFSDSFEPCYRCMMIYEKHYNVLQYKESK